MRQISSLKSVLITTSALAILTLGACQPSASNTNTPDTPETSQTSQTQATDTLPAVNQNAVQTLQTQASSEPTLQEAKEFIEIAEKETDDYLKTAAHIAWINANFITYDTNELAKQSGAIGAKLSTRHANMAKRFNDLKLPADMARKIDRLKRGSNFPAPEKEGAAEELAGIMTDLTQIYGTGKFEYKDQVMTLGQLSDIIAESRDPEELSAVWAGWRTVSPSMKDQYVRMVDIINEGAQDLGFADAGALWRAGYDMPADDFVKESDRLWGQVKPLYDELHCYVRAGLNEQYGDEIVPLDQPMRADLLGNMWGQSWGNIYELVAPKDAAPSVDITALLKENNYDQLKMVQVADQFFASLGFDPMPDTFWERSLITKPEDREVVCHASAWNIDNQEDIRIKMCTKINGEDFSTVHHELGHNIYQRAYKDQPVFYKDGANDGFHEAIGDMIALSITPEYLVEIGLLDADAKPDESADIALLMRQALDKVAFLPFGLMVDQWRWKVFSGEYGPEEYNSGWWELRNKYQGLRAPIERGENDFDPGAKYHIPGNTPYMRYFLSHILQFQFHKSACEIAGFEGPLHRCSIYNNKDVGERFNAMLGMGASKPWPDALEAFTGTREMDGSAILEYFAPLLTYLRAQNESRTCGWE